MIARSVALTGLVVLALAGPVSASAQGPSRHAPDVPPRADRIAATNATFDAIEAKVAAGQPLNLRFPDPTAAIDILDYGVHDLWKNGVDGAGVTVAYVVTNPDPGLQSSMATYDAAMNLPPADITDLALPAPADPNAVCQVECSTGEDRLDAEAIHSIAPFAKILFVHPPVPETVGMQGWPELAQAIEMISDRHLADVISVSMGDAEKAFVDDPTNPTATQAAAIHSLDPAFLDAAARDIPVLFASGDCGPTGPPVLADTGQCTPPLGVTAGHPADNPWVTAVGGTIPNAGLATATGRTAPDALWTARNDHSDAEGAGVSAVYAKPWWQHGIPALQGVSGRAYPDISLDADDGTSQASPTLAGILALATQLRGSELGPVNPALAQLGRRGAAAGIVDVPAGFSNTAFGVTGFATGAGYDIASGWGTIFAPRFVPALVREVEHGRPVANEARTELRRLQDRISVSARMVSPGDDVTVTGSGFVPGRTPNGTTVVDGFGVFPPLPGQFGAPPGGPFADPTSTVPGQSWDQVSATVTGPRKHTASRHLDVAGPDGTGTVTATVDTSGLAPGRYTVTIAGQLISQSASFAVRHAQHH
jgi:Subtilase family